VTQDKDPKTVTGLGEAMGVIVILFLLLPITALTLRASIEIITIPNCKINNGNR
jgi:hypothetical protein